MRRLCLIALCAFALILSGTSLAQNYPKAGGGKSSSSKGHAGVIKQFLQHAQSGNESGAVALCDFEVGNGTMKGPVPAEEQVKKLIGFLRSRTLKKIKVSPIKRPKLVQYKYRANEDGRIVIINVKPVGKKWLISAINV